MSEALKSPDSLVKALRDASIPVDSPGASYDDMLKFERDFIDTGRYSLSAENEWYLMRGFEAANSIMPSLEARHWGALVSPSGGFIGSDNPVVLDGPVNQQIGFKSAEIVIFPVNRYVLLHGTKVPVKSPSVNRKRIAKHNTFIMITADQYVYSHVPNFCWLGENGVYQTDWRLFSREKSRSFNRPVLGR